jgi:tetratricopeptide (TPR) repeat protein
MRPNLSKLAGVLAVVLLIGCAGPPTPERPAAGRDLVAEAMVAMERADWASAADLLRQALTQDPSRANLHYSLAVAASHLGQRDEAIREFQWVLANVAPELAEAVEARRWLTEAGLLARRPETPIAWSDRVTEETPGDSGLEGRVVWADGRSTARLQLFLKGAPKSPNETLQWVLRTDDSGRFEFQRIPAGTYMLTNKIAGEPTWRLRVQLEPGQVTTLDLGEANNAKVRDDFPGR